MRASLFLIGLGFALLGLSAEAQTSDNARTSYYSELDRQCPERRLQLLSQAQLRDALDDFSSSLEAEAQDRLRTAEQSQCSSSSQGAACVNDADLAVVDEMGRTPDLAASVCGFFLRCRTQSDCDRPG